MVFVRFQIDITETVGPYAIAVTHAGDVGLVADDTQFAAAIVIPRQLRRGYPLDNLALFQVEDGQLRLAVGAEGENAIVGGIVGTKKGKGPPRFTRLDFSESDVFLAGRQVDDGHTGGVLHAHLSLIDHTQFADCGVHITDGRVQDLAAGQVHLKQAILRSDYSLAASHVDRGAELHVEGAIILDLLATQIDRDQMALVRDAIEMIAADNARAALAGQLH